MNIVQSNGHVYISNNPLANDGNKQWQHDPHDLTTYSLPGLSSCFFMLRINEQLDTDVLSQLNIKLWWPTLYAPMNKLLEDSDQSVSWFSVPRGFQNTHMSHISMHFPNPH